MSDEISPLQKRDALTIIYKEIIAIVGSDSNVEEIFESLAESGLGVNVVYNLITDSGFYAFDIVLYKYLTQNDIITLSSLISALLSSGIVIHIIADIIGNSTYLKLAINFFLGIFTGAVPLFALITAIF